MFQINLSKNILESRDWIISAKVPGFEKKPGYPVIRRIGCRTIDFFKKKGRAIPRGPDNSFYPSVRGSGNREFTG